MANSSWNGYYVYWTFSVHEYAHCYYGLQVATVTTPTEHNTPKMEATNWQLVSLCTAHIRSKKILQYQILLLHSIAVSGYFVL